jgi:hypothetical protein
MKSGGWVGETSKSRGTNGEDGGALSATAAPQHTTRGGAFGATADVRPGPRSTTRGEDAQSSLHLLVTGAAQETSLPNLSPKKFLS